ncbi:cadmium resistance transporter [Fructilactobacillus hinvesii]|uniref:Cadmium resistance transporter n=1 Tax=Fructilactobacillus hinvesii TaxID=2940300 RepID=A0ABY5BTQ8_9LACO|nr:cadmium resistance transporter [Fructilactobacillus hinvesii]USS88229.1 cadmium resistance transporter [Fructilactobacillus hinvesii]
MNLGLLTLTFIAVNLDFWVLLLFFLNRFSVWAVLSGYLTGLILLLCLSYGVGQTLAYWLPEWVLGGLGFLPLYLAVRGDNDDDETPKRQVTPVVTVFLTYLTVCAGCNLAIFVPVLLGQSISVFLVTVAYLVGLTVLVVLGLQQLSHWQVLQRTLARWGTPLMRLCYLAIGLYVLFDSGFIRHIMGLLTRI